MSLNDTITGAFKSYLESSRSSDELSHTKELKFYVSDMGKCLRMRYLKRKGIKGSFGWETYYTFAHGDFIHTLGYKALEAKGILLSTEQSFGNDHFSGRYDGTLSHENQKIMFDFKSTNPYVLKRLIEGGSDNVENVMQVLSAIIFTKVANPKSELSDIGAVVYVNKLPSDKVEPSIIHTKEYHLSIYQKDIQADMDKIVDYWLTDKIPPCTCPLWAIQKYNSFFLFCKMDDKQIKKHLDYLAARDTITTDGYNIMVTKRKEE